MPKHRYTTLPSFGHGLVVLTHPIMVMLDCGSRVRLRNSPVCAGNIQATHGCMGITLKHTCISAECGSSDRSVLSELDCGLLYENTPCNRVQRL